MKYGILLTETYKGLDTLPPYLYPKTYVNLEEARKKRDAIEEHDLLSGSLSQPPKYERVRIVKIDD